MDELAKVPIWVFGSDPRPVRSAPAPLSTPAPQQPRAARREAEPFVHVTDREFLAGVKALDSAQELAVWVYLLRETRWRQRVGQPESFALTNGRLRAWAGIGRTTKARALQKLEAAGLLRLERDGRCSPEVTICGP